VLLGYQDVRKKPKIKVQNIVASGTIDMRLNLNLLALELENTEYDPHHRSIITYEPES
jgi:TATA-box binding protein (TBP) (component of TFIID and TFIIIB)